MQVSGPDTRLSCSTLSCSTVMRHDAQKDMAMQYTGHVARLQECRSSDMNIMIQ